MFLSGRDQQGRISNSEHLALADVRSAERSRTVSMVWQLGKTAEAVRKNSPLVNTPLKRGVNGSVIATLIRGARQRTEIEMRPIGRTLP